MLQKATLITSEYPKFLNKMKQSFRFQSPLESRLVVLILILGVFFTGYASFFASLPYPNLQAGAFLDTVKVPFNSFSIGSLEIPIQLDNFLVFQNFISVAPSLALVETYLVGTAFFLLFCLVLSAISYFEKLPFIGAGIVWIILLTLTNVNGLNLGGKSTNIPLIISISGSLLPVIYFYVWKNQVPFILRFISILLVFGGSLAGMMFLSDIPNPGLYLAEHSFILALGLGLAWLFWQGHGFISGFYVLLSKAGRNLPTKISWQISLISALYFAILIILLIELKGYTISYFPTFPAWYLVVPIGILGWLSTNEKLEQSETLAGPAQSLKILYFSGFAILIWCLGKVEFSSNQPAEELIKHTLVYTQLAFTLFFIIYAMTNFLPVMNSGKSVHKILYKPYSLSYYHLRIGGLISLLVILVYMDAIVAVQANSLTSNILGDYYYQSGQKLEASFLYEDSWFKYRKNQKAKNSTAHLLFELNQPTLAKAHLEQSFAEAPQVDNIILLAERLNRENKIFEAIYYLEDGLKTFPKSTELRNNLALFYLRTNDLEKVQNLFQEGDLKNSIFNSNYLAFLGKTGATPNPEIFVKKDIPSLINQIALLRKSDLIPGQDLKKELQDGLNTNLSPMVIQAGWRNIVTESTLENPSGKIKFLDSLAGTPSYLDYTMQLQESAILQSLSAGRIGESVINLNGLAFRNPNDAAYYLNLSGLILSQNLDFNKAANDFKVAREKGFKAFSRVHYAIFKLGNKETEADSLAKEYPHLISEDLVSELTPFQNFNQTLPEGLFQSWQTMPDNRSRIDFAKLLLLKKSHGLTSIQIQEIGQYIINREGENTALGIFISNPDWTVETSIKAFLTYFNLSEELSANPYHTPLILNAADRIQDPLAQYELINSASDFNQDPLLWIRKVQAARRIGLDNYASQALQDMSEWLSWDEIEMLQMRLK